MKKLLRPLRRRLALAGFVAIYVPAVLLATFGGPSEDSETIAETNLDQIIRITETSADWRFGLVAAVVMLPVAAGLSWWWAGRAVRPVAETIAVQEALIEEASHELRTPLSILTNNAEVLLEHPEPTLEVYRAGLVRSRDTANRMTNTIDSLLVDARGRARSIVIQPVGIGQVVDRAMTGVAHLAVDNGVTLQRVGESNVRARVDAASFERAVTNLLTNALSASPSGSVVAVEVTNAAKTVEVAVTDQGPGIAAEDQQQVFERYWQGGDDTSNGSGIGLSIVRQVAEAHGGAVTVESPVANDRGSRFRLEVVR